MLGSSNALSNKIAKAFQQADIKFTRKVGLGTKYEEPFVMGADINVYDPDFDTVVFTLCFNKDNPDDYDVEVGENLMHKLGKMDDAKAKQYQAYNNKVNQVLSAVINK